MGNGQHIPAVICLATSLPSAQMLSYHRPKLFGRVFASSGSYSENPFPLLRFLALK